LFELAYRRSENECLIVNDAHHRATTSSG
jgi:hypothetical protein